MVAQAFEPVAEEALAGGRWRAAIAAAVEVQAGRAMLWTPLALTFGIWTYFWLAREPAWWLAAAAGAAALGLVWFGRTLPPLILIALLFVGFVLAKAHSGLVAAPLITAATGEVLVTGRVAAAEPGGRRQVVVLAVEAVEGLSPGLTPSRLRLTASRKQGEARLGTRIAVKARLSPLPSPVMPGGFDYGRDLWFDGIGGTGRITAPITVLDAAVPWTMKLKTAIEDLRRTIGARIHAGLDPPFAAFAEAQITGERGAIPQAVVNSLLDSGLFHVLSISGLHMSLVAGGVFWLVRALLAAVPGLALTRPIKKWSAAAAIAAGLFYMLLAGAGVATQRSFLMIAIALFAVLIDRPAISVRNLALAALFILVLEPEAAISASFQMSFLAVMGLTAFYEFWSDWRSGTAGRRAARPLPVRLGLGLLSILAASVVTTLIAGSLSSIPAAYHFGRMAPYSVIANGLALPVISFVVMPMALASVLLMPFGLEAWPLWAMGEGLELVLAISDWVAGLSGAHLVVPRQTVIGMVVAASGAALLCLLAGRVRLVGIPVMLLGFALGPLYSMPDILVERTAANVAFRNAHGELVFANPRKGRFAAEKWLVANGEEADLKEAAARSGWNCTARACTATIKGRRLAYWRKAEGEDAAPLSCAGIDILIADYPLRGACRDIALRIDRFDVWRNGAHALRLSTSAVEVETERGTAGARPWVVVPEARKDRLQRP